MEIIKFKCIQTLYEKHYKKGPPDRSSEVTSSKYRSYMDIPIFLEGKSYQLLPQFAPAISGTVNRIRLWARGENEKMYVIFSDGLTDYKQHFNKVECITDWFDMPGSEYTNKHVNWERDEKEEVIKSWVYKCGLEFVVPNNEEE